MKKSRARITSISLIAPLLFLMGANLAHASSVSISSPEPSATIAIGTPVTFTVTATGFIGPMYFLSDSFVDGSLGKYDLSSAGQFSWTPAPNDVGSHTIAITVTDDSGDTGSATIALDVVSAGSAVTTTATPVTTTTAVSTPVTTTADVTTAPAIVTPTTSVTTTTTTAPAVQLPEFTQDMTTGSTGSEVTELQQLLTAQGDMTAPVTGYYASLTQAAVMKFQTAHSIQPLGIVGPQTLSALNTIVDSENATATAAASVPTTSTVTTPTTSTAAATLPQIQSEIQSISSSLSQVESQLSQLLGV